MESRVERVVLETDRRHLVTDHAVVEGRCALFDTDSGQLVPLDLGRAAR